MREGQMIGQVPGTKTIDKKRLAFLSLVHRYRGQARSHRGLGFAGQIRFAPLKNVGAGLPAMAVGQLHLY
jgi:hypothetical protein